MKFNGSYRYGGPVWAIVSGVHNLIAYAAIVAAICLSLLVLLQLVFLFMPDDKPKELIPEEKTQPLPLVLSPEQIEKQKLAYEQRQKEAAELMVQEQKRIEAEQLLEEQRKQEIIKARRERSAKDVARAGLDDFL